jgi:hypothetical protein
MIDLRRCGPQQALTAITSHKPFASHPISLDKHFQKSDMQFFAGSTLAE